MDDVILVLGGSDLKLGCDDLSRELRTGLATKLKSNCECRFRLVEPVCV